MGRARTQRHHIPQRLAHEGDRLSPPLVICLERFPLRQKQGRRKLGKWKRVIASLDKDLGPLVDDGIASENRPAAAGSHEFAASKAEHAHIAPCAGWPARHNRSRRLTCVFDDRGAVRIGQFAQSRHVDERAMQMRHENRLGARSQGFADLLEVGCPVVGRQVE